MQKTFDKLEDWSYGSLVLNKLSDSDLSNILVALEKQIPKKALWIERSFTKFQICPSCSNAEHYKMVWKQEKYCVDCGQKLDWSNEDAE